MNGVPLNPEVPGIEAIVQLYRQRIEQKEISLSGPTYFGPILGEFLNFVQSVASNRVYPVLLLLTDGEIFDMPQTRDYIY